MNKRRGTCLNVLLIGALCCTAAGPRAWSQQIAIGRIDQMPDRPAPYQMRNWKSVAAAFDSAAFDLMRSGQYLPLIQLYSNTVNYPSQESFRIQSYVGAPGPGGEAVTCLPAIVGAGLVGIDKTNQGGTNWVAMAQEWFNSADGEQVYLNSPSAGTGDDWWYETMPNVFAFQIASLFPGGGDFPSKIPVVAGRWRAAVAALGGSTTPWGLANFNHRAINLLTMKPTDASVPEPEAAGAIAWILYMAYVRTGNQDFRVGAELALESLLVYTTNPSYELQLPYGTEIAARMNAELGTTYDLTKMMNWCFASGNGTLRQWGAIVGNWGGFDCSGLIGESGTSNDYAFFMNGVEQAGALVPLVRYDDRYARAVGKWVLNVANASRLLYANYLPDSHQDSAPWAHAQDSGSAIAYEAMHQFSLANGTITPFATGDAVRNGWAETNLGLYGAAHVGILGGIIDTTNVPMILRLDLLRTDYFHQGAYPTYCYFNPYAADTAVTLALGAGAYDIYSTVAKQVIIHGATGAAQIPVPADGAQVVVIAPAGGLVTTLLDRTMINGVVVDFRNGYTGNHPPRIKSLAPDSSRILLGTPIYLYCAAADRDSDNLAYAWSATRGAITGTGPVVTWTAPDTPAQCVVTCTVSDGRGGSASASDTLQAIAAVHHPPVIQRMLAVPRKVDLGAASTITVRVSNPDSSSLAYAWSASAGSITGSGSTVTWHAPGTAGNDTVRCTVDDGKGGRDSSTLALEVRDLSIVQTGDLVAWYPFNGDARDATGHGHDGTASNVTYVPDRFGRAASAAAFDGTSSNIGVPDDSALNFQNAITVNLWVTPGAFPTAREEYIISHGNWTTRWKLSVSPGTERLRWTVKNASGSVKDLDAASPLVVDSLVNVTARYDGTDMEIYLDGYLDAFTPFTGPIGQTTYALSVAQDLPTDNQYDFAGVLDEIRIYNYGLGLSDIAALYDIASSVTQRPGPALPSRFDLLQNYPNPFNPTTTITFAVPGGKTARPVSLRVYDLLGREVATLASGSFPAGTYSVVWDGTSCSSGVYLCRLESGGTSIVRKLLYVK
ncbi:MAG TPA: LamG-like jellyroll fold domain-containing protein [Bacteroidota bacterium]|nr:LamG-like jellyroll fold domain-containing protein [Bacteroidota bacterium]